MDKNQYFCFMNTVILNYGDSKVSPITENLAMRMSYVFSKFPVIIGTIGTSILIYDNFFDKSHCMEYKASIIRTNVKKSDKKLYEMMEEVVQSIKKYNKIKFKTPDVIITHKKMQRIIDEIFEEQIEESIAKVKDYGLYHLRPLLDRNQIDYFNLDAKVGENIKNLGEKNVKPSDVFKYILDNNFETKPFSDLHKNGGSMLCLTNEFFETELFEKFSSVKFNDANAMEADTIMLEPFFSFPSIHTLSNLELEAIRNDLNELMNPFITAFNQWIELSKNNSPDSLNYFIKNILPLKDAIQTRVNDNEILKYIEKIMARDTQVDLHVGCISVKMLLEYFIEVNVLKDETLTIVNNYVNDKGISNYKLPFMVIDLPNAPVVEDVKNEDVIQSVKKYLTID